MLATVVCALAALIALCLYGSRAHNYWRQRGVRHMRPLPFLGTYGSVYLMQKSTTQVATDAYCRFPEEKVVGQFWASKPQLLIRDPEIIKRVLTTDFAHFYPRGLNPHKEVIEPLLRNLFFADGDLWRLLRQRMTPAFTSGKLKAMFPLIVERAERLQVRTLAAAHSGRELDARDLMARYTTDFIGACGFGLDADSLNDEKSAFRKLGAQIFSFGAKEVFVAMMKEVFPELCKHMKYLSRVEGDIMDLVKSVLKNRNYEPSGRNDFIDLLLECRQKGTIVGESIERMSSDGSAARAELDLSDELIAAQVFVFFAAGFETSSSATSFTLHQLAYHPEVQRKVQEDIDAVLSKHDNKLCYDAVKEMTYLEWTFKEAMRMFPSLGFLIRECAKKFTFPEINLTIDEGVVVMIPVQALHNDPKYFRNPEEFRPERFSPEEFQSVEKFVYLPFGAGPRACIGERLGQMQSLAGLAAVLAGCSVAPGPSTRRSPRVNPASDIVQSVRDGLPLRFIPRTQKPL
ncbi:cytochrome P450 6B6 [Papilio machaon]|uniref:cytochrome P450 6B6 n=1 Tax=Papilio machaon TaxID=76193 RepID=UPI001E664483|nr:cytochrome P450 6B6 [Papilio machaon]XP_045538814.1 cytochrome P450 6B6 [Papilio machaon]